MVKFKDLNVSLYNSNIDINKAYIFVSGGNAICELLFTPKIY